jgi:hypothetical protein
LAGINITETGFTFSEYAGRLSELVTVAVLSLILYLAWARSPGARPPPTSAAFHLACALIALVVVILVSALQRLLYEDAAGSPVCAPTHLDPLAGRSAGRTIVLEACIVPGVLVGAAAHTFGFYSPSCNQRGQPDRQP